MYVEALVFDQYSDLPVDKFNFKLEPVSKCYDTSEEVKELASSEVKKGISFEIEFKEKLELQYPKNKIKLIKNSGLYQDSFDVEMRQGKKLFIFDFCTLIAKKHDEKIYFYLNLNHKNSQRYEDVEKKRNAKTYFAFIYDNDYWVVSASKIWELTDKSTIPLSKVLHISQTLESFG